MPRWRVTWSGADMSHIRLTESCMKKCVPGDYREGDLNKGESVCLDRCVSKYFEVNVKVSEKMQGISAQQSGGGGGGMFGR
jgi:mitochondrial import inner membrane translocase subunit TIM10